MTADTYIYGEGDLVGTARRATVLEDGGKFITVSCDDGEMAVNNEWEEHPEYEVKRSEVTWR